MDSSFSLNYLTSQLERRSFPKQMKLHIESILRLLAEPKIDIAGLRKLCELGIPDDIKGTNAHIYLGLRSLCWKLLIGYLPPDKSKWLDVTHTQRDTYRSFCSDFLKPK